MARICLGSYKLKEDGVDTWDIPANALGYTIEGNRIKFYPEIYENGHRPVHAIPKEAKKVEIKSRSHGQRHIEREKKYIF